MNVNIPQTRLLTLRQAENLFGIDREEWYDAIRSGALPAYRTGNGPTSPYRVKHADVERWLETRRVPVAA